MDEPPVLICIFPRDAAKICHWALWCVQKSVLVLQTMIPTYLPDARTECSRLTNVRSPRDDNRSDPENDDNNAQEIPRRSDDGRSLAQH